MGQADGGYRCSVLTPASSFNFLTCETAASRWEAALGFACPVFGQARRLPGSGRSAISVGGQGKSPPQRGCLHSCGWPCPLQEPRILPCAEYPGQASLRAPRTFISVGEPGEPRPSIRALGLALRHPAGVPCLSDGTTVGAAGPGLPGALGESRLWECRL